MGRDADESTYFGLDDHAMAPAAVRLFAILTKLGAMRFRMEHRSARFLLVIPA
jgi:hypothetical protein